jgi:CRISPR/Cas system-associated endoribonuclease Cas2
MEVPCLTRERRVRSRRHIARRHGARQRSAFEGTVNRRDGNAETVDHCHQGVL